VPDLVLPVDQPACAGPARGRAPPGAAEELFVVVSGRVIFELEGEQVEATPGTVVFTRQGTQRTAVAAEPATTILVFDGTPGKAYDATGWELWAPLRPLYDNGDHRAKGTTNDP